MIFFSKLHKLLKVKTKEATEEIVPDQINYKTRKMLTKSPPLEQLSAPEQLSADSPSEKADAIK